MQQGQCKLYVLTLLSADFNKKDRCSKGSGEG